MLAGNNENIVAPAIRSVIDWVDSFLLVDTGIADRTAGIAHDLAGDKLRVERFEWCDDFASARNFALERATATRATWALTIDTDERLVVEGYKSIDEFRRVLEGDLSVLTWMVPARDGSYSKERLVRLPTRLAWKGRTHEALVGATTTQRRVLPGVRFFEERKTPGQFRAKLERDLAILREETQQQPHNARWWFYLGQTLEQLEDYAEAILAYRRCCDLREGWAEQAAWASYCAANCFLKLEDYETALEVCAFGLSRQAASPELAWLAGFCCYQLGRYADAIAWEEMAIAIGSFEGSAAAERRISFRYLPGWYEAPFDVLRFAHRQLGDIERAKACQAKYQQAIQVRQIPKTTDPIVTGATASEPLAVSGQACTRVAVVGLYGSGSSAVAGILHHLGVTMGREFWGDHFEARWLSQQLRTWWREPELTAAVPQSERVRVLREWAEQMQATCTTAVGLKHPLLSLCGPDLVQAWGADTKFIWCYRPLEDSIASLARRKWWPGRERQIQNTLWNEVHRFFEVQSHVKINFEDLLRYPEEFIQSAISSLNLSPNDEQTARALASIQSREVSTHS